MDQAQWQEVEERLSHFYNRVILDCDGYRVTLELQRLGVCRNVISAYVNGWIKGEWILNDCEERRRFWQKRGKWVWSEKQRKALKRIRSLRGKVDPDAKVYVWYPHWSSFGALKRHLVANNKEISLIKENVIPADAGIQAAEAKS